MRSPLSDGEWHRLHPLTPLLRGGLFLVVVIGIIVANLRDRLLFLFLPAFAPDIPAEDLEDFEGSGDPIDFIIANNLYLAAGIGLLLVLLALSGIFYLSWRFHTFRITGDDVEVRSGILFRTQRRAPLDRVQGVNLTRPMIARLAGMAKLEVVGAGTDANVKLEYLSTVNAEAVRADILRLASGGRSLKRSAGSAANGRSRMGALTDTVSRGITGLIEGDEAPVAVPESVVHIPFLRLIVSHVVSPATVGLVFGIGAIAVGSAVGTPWLLIGMVPAVIGFVAYWVRSILRSLRYSIAPTPDGVRITFGLLTTDHRDRAARTRPRGRGLAVGAVAGVRLVDGAHQPADGSQSQRLQHRPVHDRPSGRHPARRRAGAAADPAGCRRGGLADHRPAGHPRSRAGRPVHRHPSSRVDPAPAVVEAQRLPHDPDVLLLRRGVIWRKLAILPLARLQSLALHQGPLDRALGVASARAHTVAGPVDSSLGAIDRDAALGLFADAAAGAVRAASVDRIASLGGGARDESRRAGSGWGSSAPAGSGRCSAPPSPARGMR